MVVLLPQNRWVGNTSLVICTSRLTRDVPRAVAALAGGCGDPSWSGNSSEQSVWLEKAQASANHHAHDERTWPQRFRPANWSTLSAAACQEVRELYWQDAELYRRHCAEGG